MAEKTFIADKATQDAIKNDTGLIGAPNPTVADETTIFNFLKKLNGSIGQAAGGYVPKMSGSIGLHQKGIVFPYKNSYIIYYTSGDREYLGLLDKGRTKIIANVSWPTGQNITRYTFNFEKGYAYHTYDGGVASVDLSTFAVKNKAITGSYARGLYVSTMSDGNALVINIESTTWFIMTPDLQTVLKTITVNTATAMSSLNATVTFEPSSNMVYMGYSDTTNYMSVKSYYVDPISLTATLKLNKNFVFSESTSNTSSTILIYTTKDYVIFFTVGSWQYVIHHKDDLPSSASLGSTFWVTSTTGFFGGSGYNNNGRYMCGLYTMEQSQAGLVFINLGNNRFMMLRQTGTTSMVQSGVIGEIVDGALVPLRKIYSSDLPELNFRPENSAWKIVMPMVNWPVHNGRIVINGIEYDISDLIEA